MIRPIQYLRGIAAMMVVWHHALDQVAGTKDLIRSPPWGQYGVALFFAISGFIMLVTTWDKPITPAEFMKHRIRRVVPLYWLATLLMISIAIVAPSLFKTLKWDVAKLIESLFFIPSYSLSFPHNIEPLLVPGWSLNYEMFFYVLFALLLLVGREWRVRLIVGILCGLVLVGYIVQPSWAPARAYTNGHMLLFAVGIIAGRLYLTRSHVRQDGGHPLLMALGDASYSIYLSHLFVLGALRMIWIHIVPTASIVSSIAWMGVALTFSAIGGWLCYRLVEKPLTVRLKGSARSIDPRNV